MRKTQRSCEWQTKTPRRVYLLSFGGSTAISLLSGLVIGLVWQRHLTFLLMGSMVKTVGVVSI